MGFPWGFSGGTLIKRLCKSLLKKKLGDLILGDIDLDQLDVQLTKGTLLLSDLALNTDFINQKLSGSAIMLKEGSMKSLLVQIPLILKSCEIVVEELELVVAPSATSEVPHTDTDCSVSANYGQRETVVSTQKYDQLIVHGNPSSASRDVDEGVKRIANAVKWFLTSFHVRIKRVYVVFDPHTISDDKIPEFNRSLVFRIKETEFGTCLSEDALIKLNNFIKFQEAVIEFLQMDDVDALIQSDLETTTNESLPGQSTTAVLTGPIGGFSGTLNLSIPWRNGSLNLQKIDADVSVDSLELRVQSSSIQWIIFMWDSLQNKTVAQKNVPSAADVSTSTSRLDSSSSTSSSAKLGVDIVTINKENLSRTIFSRSKQDKDQDSFITRTHVIHNWVPELIDHEDQADLDSDYDESIDQFFECFEELRSSQMNLGNSGIWDWTCSVFNAITFASTLASGSDHLPREQLTEKTLRASISEICVVLSFSDGRHPNHSNNVVNLLSDRRNSELFVSCLSSTHFEQSHMTEAAAVNLNMHHLEARCQNVHLDLETYPQNLKCKASIGDIKLDEYYSTGSDASEQRCGFRSTDNPFLSHYLREEIQVALPPFSFSARDHMVESYYNYDAETTGHGRGSGNSNGLTKVELLQTFDKCKCHYDVSSAELDGKSMTATSISVLLPPLIFWVHFHTVYMLLDFVNKVESPSKRTDVKEIGSGVLCEGHNTSAPGADESSKFTTRTIVSPASSLKGQIAFSPSRIIICFPSDNTADFSCPSFLDKFIVVDHSSSLNIREASPALLKERSHDPYLGTPSTLINLAMGNLDIYVVRSAKEVAVDRFCKSSRQTLSAMKILSVTSRSTDNDCGIAMIWKKCSLAGPEMADKAWSLSTLHNQRSTERGSGKGAGFSSYTTSQDLEDSSSNIRQELLRSTEFLLDMQLSCVSVHLGKKDCELLNNLLNHVLIGLSNGVVSTSENTRDVEPTPSDQIAAQTSILLKCSVLDVCTELDKVIEVSHLLQAELEGSWNCLKLCIEKFELLSVLNIGGVNNASFVWVNHGEGELWGSISSRNEKTYEVSKDLLLVVCRESASRRGDGEGTNVLSFGTAGSSVTHMWNPKLCQSYTSVDVRSGTIIAPGGRLDWINAICLLFGPGSPDTEQSVNDRAKSNSTAAEVCKSSFFLELVDVAVSYEPHFKSPTVNDEALDLGAKYVACLLAAASFRLSNKAALGSTDTTYNIQLQDLGLLICESTGSKNAACGYNVDYLRQTGYAKVAQNTLIEAVLRMNGSFWKLMISDSQFNVGTCHDTTYGLIRLISQLQQLYAPDMQDALVHLQSRWNSIQQTGEQHVSIDTLDYSEASSKKSAVAEDKSEGLLDEVIDNAFSMDKGLVTTNFWDINSHPSLDGAEIEDGLKIHVTIPEASDANFANVPLGTSSDNSEADITQIPSRHNSYSPEIIESYYVPNLPSSSTTFRNYANEDCCSKVEDNARKDVEGGDGGWYNDGSLMIVENHISKMNSPHGEKQLKGGKFGICMTDTDESCNLKARILLQDIHVRWRMYAGDDWSKTRNDSTCSSSSNGRDGVSSLEFTISGLNVQYDMHPDGEVCVSKLSVCAQDINLCDRSMNAPWTMVLGCYNSKDYPRESCSCAFRLELDCVRPEPLAPLEDYRLHLEFLPLRLHLDQGQLNFLVSFFHSDSSIDNAHLPHDIEITGRDSMSSRSQMIVEEALLPFFQKFDVRPLVLRIDYIPHQFDPIALSKGNYAELLNIVPWKGIDLKLKHVSAIGIYGWSSICETVVGEWLEDISHNQVHKLLKGLPPIRSLFSVSSGTSKLVSLPIKSYRKDGKLLKGMQRGAVAFVRSISIEAVGLGVHLAAGAHEILLKTECILTTIPPPLPPSEVRRAKENIRSNQPESAQQGIKQAYDSLTDGLGRTASALIGTPLKVYQRGAGAGSALATAICAAPAAAVAPVSASARAVHYALLGLRNSLDPEHKRESMDKYLGPSQS